MYKYIKAVHKKTKDITVALTVREMSIKLNALEISITKALNNRTTLINHTIRTISKSEYCILTGNKLPEEEKQEISIPLPLSVPSHRELEALQIRTEQRRRGKIKADIIYLPRPIYWNKKRLQYTFKQPLF